MRRILVVDDSAVNRAIIKKMLGDSYEVCEAENGAQALAILSESHKSLSAVLLDIVMPEMDGFELLEKIRQSPAWMQLPVLMMTGMSEKGSELRALELGANDYIVKPYAPEIVKTRLHNTIKLRETAAAVNALQRDALTGLYTRDTFFRIASDMIKAHPPGYYIMACFDINNFKVINDQHGSEKGDDVLAQVARIFEQGFLAAGGAVGRIMADNFAVLYPDEFAESDEIVAIRRAAGALDGSIPPISFSIGRYTVGDLTLPVSAMYDRAALAMASIKGRFDVEIAEYDESMRLKLIDEQRIVVEMKQALAQNQFETWFQPQYNHASGALIGAEALVRWRHPQRGLIPPGVFVPIFEKNGFIYEVDKFVWESVCRMLRGWLDEGRSPMPVSVNVSRYDIFRDDLTDVIVGLVVKYDLPPSMLRLEITESAFAKSAEQIISVVRGFIDRGFTVEIDDFGSGYSSLNTLKDVPAQIVKLDMRFLDDTEGSTDRGGNILESIVRMAKWLGMAVIAEGVETQAQADFLKSIGCDYMQGYLYAKPMPKAQYESLAKEHGKEEKLITLETVENLNNNAFWNPESMDTLIFNSYVGGACIFEFSQGRIELIRVTDKYVRVIGSAGMTASDALALDWTEHLDKENYERVKRAIRRSLETRDETTEEFVFVNLPGCPQKTYLRSTLRVIATAGERCLIYCTNENITAQREAEEEKALVVEQLRAMMESMSGGVTAATVENGVPRLVFANEQFYKLHGYTREQFELEIDDPQALIAPEDRALVAADRLAAVESDRPVTSTYRIVKRDGTICWMRSNISMTRLPGVQEPVRLAIANDITAEKLALARIREADMKLQAIMSNMTDGVSAAVISGGYSRYIFANDQFFSMIGYTREQFFTELPNGIPDIIHPDDFKKVGRVVEANESSGGTATIVCRVFRRDGSLLWMRANGSVCRIEGVDQPVHIAVHTDITAEREAMERIQSLNENLQNMMNDAPGGFARMRVKKDGTVATLYVNENLCRLRGMSHDSILRMDGRDASSSIHPDDLDTVRCAVLNMLASKKTASVTYRLRTGQGEYVAVNAFGRISKNEAGELFVNAYFTEAGGR